MRPRQKWRTSLSHKPGGREVTHLFGAGPAAHQAASQPAADQPFITPQGTITVPVPIPLPIEEIIIEVEEPKPGPYDEPLTVQNIMGPSLWDRVLEAYACLGIGCGISSIVVALLGFSTLIARTTLNSPRAVMIMLASLTMIAAIVTYWTRSRK